MAGKVEGQGTNWDDQIDPVDWPDSRDDELYVYPDPEMFPNERCYTVSCSPNAPGWRTDMGCEGYGLTLKVAQEIVGCYNLARDY